MKQLIPIVRPQPDRFHGAIRVTGNVGMALVDIAAQSPGEVLEVTSAKR